MADADFARATIVKAQDGFNVVVVLKRGEQIDAWSLDSFEALRTLRMRSKRSPGSTTCPGNR